MLTLLGARLYFYLCQGSVASSASGAGNRIPTHGRMKPGSSLPTVQKQLRMDQNLSMRTEFENKETLQDIGMDSGFLSVLKWSIIVRGSWQESNRRALNSIVSA